MLRSWPCCCTNPEATRARTTQWLGWSTGCCGGLWNTMKHYETLWNTQVGNHGFIGRATHSFSSYYVFLYFHSNHICIFFGVDFHSWIIYISRGTFHHAIFLEWWMLDTTLKDGWCSDRPNWITHGFVWKWGTQPPKSQGWSSVFPPK